MQISRKIAAPIAPPRPKRSRDANSGAIETQGGEKIRISHKTTAFIYTDITSIAETKYWTLMAKPCRYRAKSRHLSPHPPLAFPRRHLRSNRDSHRPKITNLHQKTTSFKYTDNTCIAETKYWSLMAKPCRYRAKSRHPSPHPPLAFPRRHLGSNRDSSRRKNKNRHQKTTAVIYADNIFIAETKHWSLMAKPCRYRAKSRLPSPLPLLAFPRRHLRSNRD